MGNKDGMGMHATFNSPSDVTVNQQTGDLYVSDLGNHSIRKITPQGNLLTTSLLSCSFMFFDISFLLIFTISI